jgi:hypothetical protein
MTLDEFRSEMEAYRLSVDAEANSRKDSQWALEQLRSLYLKFDDAERKMANQVLPEWVLSEDESARFDALALVGDFEVAEAVTTLKVVAVRLASSIEPGTPFELEKVNQILRKTGAT